MKPRKNAKAFDYKLQTHLINALEQTQSMKVLPHKPQDPLCTTGHLQRSCIHSDGSELFCSKSAAWCVIYPQPLI